MRVTTPLAHLKKILPKFKKIIGDKTVHAYGPAYPHYDQTVFYASKKNGLWVTGSNGEKTLSLQVAAEVHEEGSCYCSTTILRDLIGNAKRSPSELTLTGQVVERPFERHKYQDGETITEKGTTRFGPFLAIEHGSARYRVGNRFTMRVQRKGLIAPLVRALDGQHGARFYAGSDDGCLHLTPRAVARWCEALQQVGTMASQVGKEKNPLRDFFTGCYFLVRPQGIEVCATDGHWMGLMEMDLHGVTLDPNHPRWEAIISPTLVEYLQAVPPEATDIAVRRSKEDRPREPGEQPLSCDIGQIMFRTEGFLLTADCFEREYLDYQRVLPRILYEAVVDADQVVSIVDRLVLITKGEHTPRVRVSLRGDEMVLSDPLADPGYNREAVPMQVTDHTPALSHKEKWALEEEARRKDPFPEGVLFECCYSIGSLKKILDRLNGPIRWRFGGRSRAMTVQAIEPPESSVPTTTFLLMPLQD